MNKLASKLPLLAFVLAATLAMAMNFAGNETERYALDPELEIWYDLTGVTPGSGTYQCNLNPAEDCSFEMPDDTSDRVEAGIFVVNGNLPIAQP
ncbi:hypothetical protein [Algoriphagus sp.]|uniref:hypothetical protein n=1 Tax=Algoriphagus sp. TaxID=1872435 RepID=UPI002605FE97|nr:hypothetical protein [Algoriphagus sp.]